MLRTLTWINSCRILNNVLGIISYNGILNQLWVWIGYEICMITLEFKLCTNIMNYRDMPKEEAGGRPDG